MSTNLPGIPGLPTPPGPTVPVTIAQLAPNMPEGKRAKLAQASAWEWHAHGDVNEGSILDRKYREITDYYIAQAATDQMARAILWAFRMYQPLAEAIVKEFTYSTEKVNGSFVGDEAAGNMETTIRPLCRDTFVGNITGGLCLDYRQSQPLALWPAGALIHVIPSRRAWALGDRFATALRNHQTWLILGFAELLQDTPVVTALHDWINDHQGWRLPHWFFANHALSNMMFHAFGSPRWVETDTSYRCDAWVRENKNVCLWPIGIEVLTAARSSTNSLQAQLGVAPNV